MSCATCATGSRTPTGVVMSPWARRLWLGAKTIAGAWAVDPGLWWVRLHFGKLALYLFGACFVVGRSLRGAVAEARDRVRGLAVLPTISLQIMADPPRGADAPHNNAHTDNVNNSGVPHQGPLQSTEFMGAAAGRGSTQDDARYSRARSCLERVGRARVSVTVLVCGMWE